MGPLNIRPADKLIKNFYHVLHQHSQLEIDHEGAVRRAFEGVLAGYGKRLEWMPVTEYAYKKVRVDGTLLDPWRQRRGFWEAKDAIDDFEKEIRKKLDSGLPDQGLESAQSSTRHYQY